MALIKGLIYADVACNQIENWLKEDDYEYTRTSLSAEYVSFNVEVLSYTLSVWFSVDKQLYGFNMLNGGSKTSKDIDSFRIAFRTYVKIYQVDIPNAKKVADEFEKLIGQKSVYNKFIGTRDLGFTILFNILGKTNLGIRVKSEFSDSSSYRAEYVSYESNKTYRVMESAVYDMDGGTPVRRVKTVSLDDIVSSIEGDSDIDFSYSKKDRTLTYRSRDAVLVFGEEDGKVVLLSGNCGLCFVNETKSVSGNTLNSIIDDCLNSEYWVSIPLYEYLDTLDCFNGDTLDIDGKSYRLTSSGTDLVIHDKDKEITVSDDITLDMFIDVKSSPKPITKEDCIVTDISEEDKGVKGVKETKTVSTATVVKRLIKDEEVSAIRFIRDSDIYDVDLYLVESCGLSAERVADSTSLYTRNGLIITDEELELKTFSVSVTDDESLVKELVQSLFD